VAPDLFFHVLSRFGCVLSFFRPPLLRGYFPDDWCFSGFYADLVYIKREVYRFVPLSFLCSPQAFLSAETGCCVSTVLSSLPGRLSFSQVTEGWPAA